MRTEGYHGLRARLCVMRRETCVMASPFHLTTLSNGIVGIIYHRKLKIRVRSSHLWHNVHTKFHYFPCSYSIIMKYVKFG